MDGIRTLLAHGADVHLQTAERVVYFSSSIRGSLGGGDVYVSRFVNDHHTKPENLGPAVNSSAEDGFPDVSSDGSYLLFGRNGDIFVSFQEDGRRGRSRSALKSERRAWNCCWHHHGRRREPAAIRSR